MIALIQRAAGASVVVAGQTVGEIGRGVLALVGVERSDGEAQAERLAEKVLTYRIFPDAAGKMNLSLRDIDGGLLAVPQFTLAADTNSGTRASFSTAAEPDQAGKLFEVFVRNVKSVLPNVATGIFAADMQVRLVNDGPVTFWLQVCAKNRS